jgi:hypothetical protein
MTTATSNGISYNLEFVSKTTGIENIELNENRKPKYLLEYETRNLGLGLS